MENSYNVAKLDMYDEGYIPPAEGHMSVPMPSNNLESDTFNTLDEPISETIKRDLRAVGTKFKHVLYPVEKKSLLKEWDLWGPLILCTFMAMFLQGSESIDSHDGGPEFAEVFVIVWIGSVAVTLNSKLLGGRISFFQSVCVLGYCLLPTSLALIVCRLILFFTQSNLLFFLRLVVTTCGFLWATLAAVVFLGDSQPPRRKALAVYPIFLFYFVISWMVLSHNGN
ncbi:protein YIPF6 [Cimex lectularius]|uniref:Protein YIPF n=1 Tax=Cimex lectularius TaxID=79782 RepID=A0A8I6RRU6_CIMLE|nr:protein YIPF6 [Cimex lectularius]